MNSKSKIFKRRKIWWLNPWIIAITVVLILIAIPMVWWISTYNSMPAIVMFVVTYLSLLVFVLYLTKRSLLEPNIYVDEEEIEKRRKEILENRKQFKKELIEKDIQVLEKGIKTQVLDVWRLNPLLLKRHPLFEKIETLVIDPEKKEFHLRIQIGNIKSEDSTVKSNVQSILSNIISFIKIVAVDSYLQSLRKYFNVTIIEIYSLKEVENRDRPYPIMSLLINATSFHQFAYKSIASIQEMKKICDVIYNDGEEISPHRCIESMNTMGLT